MAGHWFPWVPEYEPRDEIIPVVNKTDTGFSTVDQDHIWANEPSRDAVSTVLRNDHDDDPISPTRFRNSW